MITKEELESVGGLLTRAFPRVPSQVIEDAMGDMVLYMLESGYKMSAGNLCVLSKFRLIKEMKRTDKVCTFTTDHIKALEEQNYDKYSPIKDGTVDALFDIVTSSKEVSERDMRIFRKAVIEREPVKDIADTENLAVSPTYRIIKKVKRVFQKFYLYYVHEI